MEFIKPGSNWEFIGRRRVFFALSSAMVLASLVSLATLGFNRGIDFKGGTKIVVAFKADADIDRGALREVLADFIKAKTKTDDAGQIEVQDFDPGSGKTSDNRNYLLLTEITSLVTDKEKADLKLKIVDALGADTQVDVAKEGEDRFFITLKEKAKVQATYDKLDTVFVAAGFPKYSVSSDVQRQAEVDNFRTIAMFINEEGEVDDAVVQQKEQNAHDKLAAELKSRTDVRFTVAIQEFRDELQKVMADKYGDKFVAVQSSTTVSPSVAGDMLNQGLVAVIYALLGIVIYITIRFDVRYAPGAIIALSHDVLIVIGCFSIAQIKFTMPIIAAVLTIAGYSINDTIVVFDRIRETIEKFPKAPMTAIINHAVNNTLSRTILTSVTTLVAVLSIFLLGGGLIRDFAFAMCIGVVVGTYSSIFVASPLFLTLDTWFKSRGDSDDSRSTVPSYATT
jgi:preprotein translocase subunit SecF